MIRNQNNQSIGAQMISAATGAAFTGAVTVYITIDAGVQAIGSVSAGLCTHEGNGYHTYRPSDLETDGALIAFTFVGSGAIPQTIQVVTITESQESAIATATGTLAITVTQLVTDALREIRVINAVDPASGEEAEFVLRKLNRLLDNWNADRLMVYGNVIDSIPITASLQPHTIGPNSATFSAIQRPVSIDGATLIVGTTRYPLDCDHDAAWWNARSDQSLTGQPTDLYYEPTWPNGSIYLYPVVTIGDTLEIVRRVVLGQLTLTDTFSLPPGYQDAITLTLAEECVGPFGVAMPQMLPGDAAKARARVFGNNAVSVKVSTADWGVPGRSGSYFDYVTRRYI